MKLNCSTVGRVGVFCPRCRVYGTLRSRVRKYLYFWFPVYPKP